MQDEGAGSMEEILAAFAAIESREQMVEFWRGVPAELEEPFMQAVESIIARRSRRVTAKRSRCCSLGWTRSGRFGRWRSSRTLEPVAEKDDAERRHNSMTLSQPQLVELNSEMNEYFSLEDIKSLCFDMGIPYESLPGEGRARRSGS